MMRSLFGRSALAVATLIFSGAIGVAAQDVVAAGPPPAVRTLLDVVVKTINAGSVDAWAAFTNERFSPDLLAKRPAAEWSQIYERIRKDFGTVTLDRAMRRGPEAPIELSVKGSTGATGVIGLGLDAGSPPRIIDFTVRLGDNDAATADGVPPPPVNRSMSGDEISRALDGYFAKLVSDDVFSGVALVARNGVPVFFKAYGFADRANKILNTTRTRFNVGSINKTFTQVAVAQLVREGKLAYTDTLGKLFPEYPQEVSRAATVEQLLTHKAGLADFFGPEFTRTAKDQFRSNADYFRFVSTLAPNFAPGTRSQYCNGCYIALGAIVERASGMPYEQYVSQHIFQRADMTSTGYPQTDLIEPGVAIGYTRRGRDAALRSNLFLHGVAGSAAGGGYSTAMDLLSYVKAVRAGRFPGAEPNMGIAGGAPGVSAVVEAGGEWTTIILSNLDPPTGERIGTAIAEALRR